MVIPASGSFNAVYHLTTINHWRTLCCEQLETLRRNRHIRSVHVTIAATGEDSRSAAVQLLALMHRGCEYSVSHQVCRPADFEHPAMEYVDDLVRRDDAPVLYFHMKGVSYCPPRSQVEAWRRHLDAFVAKADHWIDVLATNAFDACGPMRLTDERHGYTYFAGNVWMASASYLRALPPYAGFVRHPPSASFRPGSRYLAEVAIDRARRLRSYATDGTLLSRRSFQEFLQQLPTPQLASGSGGRHA